MNTNFTLDVENEINRIVAFIRNFVTEHEQVVVPVSGGLDSDVVARLCCRSIGSERVKLFIVVQSEMEVRFLQNARNLAAELCVSLAEIHLEQANQSLMEALEQGETEKGIFQSKSFLDPAKAKCSIRSSVISCYQDKGFLIAGTTNRSEKEIGLFLTFGDNLAHFKPIAHLYKTQLYDLARALGTQERVLLQEPSAGFWIGQTDLEDIAYWILNDGPVVFPKEFSEEENHQAIQIKSLLTQEKIDQVLMMYSDGAEAVSISVEVELPFEIVERILHIVEKAKQLKSRPVLTELQS